MNQKKRGLSRGLNALLSSKITLEEVNSAVANKTNVSETSAGIDLNKTVVDLEISKLVPGKFQPRQTFAPEELIELSESIKTQGVLQPLIVRKLVSDNYEIVAGERRWQAAKLADLKEVPVIIKSVSDKDALTIALIENIQRSNLNPIDEAIALDRLAKEFTLTHSEVAQAIGKPRTSVSNLLRILNLPVEIKKMLENRQIDLGHAKVLLGVSYDLQLKVANQIVQDNLSVRATEQLLARLQQQGSKVFNDNIKAKTAVDPDVKRLQKKLRDCLGAKVTIFNKAKGKGKLIIEYNSIEELEGILEHIIMTEDL